MATLNEIWNLYQQASTLKCRTKAAIAMAAEAIFAEDATTENHANRLKWAIAATSNIDSWLDRFFWGVLANPTVQAAGDATTDNDLQWVVNQKVNIHANTLA